MNQLIKRNQAVILIIWTVLVLLFLAIWPANLIHKTYVSKSDEVVLQESGPVNVEHNITQMFVAEAEYLNAVDLYVTNDMRDETITFRLYDASYSELYNIFYVVPSSQDMPGFVHIPVGYEMTKDMDYYYTLEGLSTDLYVNLEDNYKSTSIVNGIMSYEGFEVEGVNPIIRYEYTSAFPWYLVALFGIILAAIGYGAYYYVPKLYKSENANKEFPVQRLFQYIGNPVIVFATLYMLYLIFPGRKFGSGPINYAFYDLSILMLSALLLYLINYKRKTDEPLMTVAKIKEHLPDWLQAVAFGMTLWYCYEYMNGLYDIHHAYSTCKIIVWLSIAIICTYKKKELIGIIPIAYFIVSAIAGYFWARAYVGVVEKDELYRLYAYVLVFGGTVIVNTITCIVALIRKKITFSKINPIYAGCLGLYLILLLIFRNTRLWPILLLVLSIFFYFRMGVWEKRNRLMENFCNGVILNFLYMMVYCWLHRPFHYYVYYRYNMAYHTVTMTAVHLTLVIAAALVKILVTYKKIKAGEKEKQSMLIPMILFGLAGAYLIFTLTRTGYLACVLTVFCMLLVFAFMEKKWKNFFIPALIMIVGTLYIFPPAFTLQRIMPALSNDPIYSEVEALPPECSIKKGDSSASNHYINIDYFIRRFANRILMMDVEWSNQESTSLPDNTPLADALLASANDANIYEIIDDETTLYLASAEDENLDSDNEETDEEDVTNGRLEIYQRYIEEWNMTGHAEMGLDFPDGTNSIHAHDVYLQMIHDHGLPSGIYIIVFILGSLVFAVIYWKNNRKDPYGMLIAAVLLGFLGAGITEWIFHPCNPFGISLLVTMTPLVFYKR